MIIACLLKYGGDYDSTYVRNLAMGVRKHANFPYEFVCLSDRASDVARDCGSLVDETIWLDHREWPGWWSKLELFRLCGPVLYFDLDTVIVGSLEPLADLVLHRLGEGQLLMVADFYRGDAQSGILGWSGDMGAIYTNFIRDYAKDATWTPARFSSGMSVGDLRFKGDGDWLRRHAAADGIGVLLAQNFVPGVVSYKVNVQGRSLPVGSSVVCFHGKPRPAELIPPPGWMAANGWRMQ